MVLKPPDYKSIVSGLDTFLKKPPLWVADIVKQHALYKHLVPMYRTIHREKPRRLVLRAIRWVNPSNFFPIMQNSSQDIANMSKEELEKSITQLNEYREESLVISNRYDEMIALIDQGQEPYRILWSAAKFGTLKERFPRAQNLKKGTSKWELAIDKMAVAMNRSLKDKGGDLGSIEALWDEEKGRIPFFADRKKKDNPPLRTTRTTREGRFEEGGRPKKIADTVSPRAARFQMPSMRESLNPELQAQRDPESVERMRAAPLYGFPEGYVNRRIGTGAMVTGAQIHTIARDFSGEGEIPAFGHWQEEEGIEITNIRSSRFVAETEDLLNLLSRPARDANAARPVPVITPAHTFSGDEEPVNISMDNLDLENAQRLSAVIEGDVEAAVPYMVEDVGALYRIPTKDGRSVLLRVPPSDDPGTVSINARLAFKLQDDLGLGSMPRVDRFTATFEGQDIDSYLVEDLMGRGGDGVLMTEDLDHDVMQELIELGDARHSLYNVMLTDLMTSAYIDPGANEMRPTFNLSVDGSRGIFVSSNVDGHFVNGATDDEGNVAKELFAGFGVRESAPRGDYGFPGGIFADDMPEDVLNSKPESQREEGEEERVSWAEDINTYMDSIFPTFQQAQAKSDDPTTGQLWGNLVSKISEGREGAVSDNPEVQWDLFRGRIANYMEQQMTGMEP